MLVGLPGIAAALRMAPSDVAEAQASLQTPFVADHFVGGSGAWAWTVPDQAGQRMALSREFAPSNDPDPQGVAAGSVVRRLVWLDWYRVPGGSWRRRDCRPVRRRPSAKPLIGAT